MTDDPKQWLEAAKQACPRTAAETSDIAYARRLKRYDCRLDNAALAQASGARVSELVKDPTINPPQLTEEQQQRLDAAQQACPPTLPEKSDIAYARRLKRYDCRLDNAALAIASGVTVGHIAADPTINPPQLTDEQQQRLEAAQQACPRTHAETSDIEYARQLKEQDPHLVYATLAKASGAAVSGLVKDSKINPPTVTDEQQQRLDAALQACPRTVAERSDIAYARRLKQQDTGLGYAALSKASGARGSQLAADPTINPPELTQEQQQRLDAAQQACPRTDADKSDIAYARLLKQRDPDLDNVALAKACGAPVGQIAADPKINPPVLTDEQEHMLNAARQACPRTACERSGIAYARRLKAHAPGLGYAALSKASGARAATIAREAKKWGV